MTRGASAPGKALLSGEYAVLEGAPAIVAAVSRRVHARWANGPGSSLAPEVAATLDRAAERVGPARASVDIDVGELYDGKLKLGLGSSAAAAVAAAGAMFDRHQHDVKDRAVREAIFTCAIEGHSAVAPSGSGVDVAASTYGGFLRFSQEEGVPTFRAVSLPEGLALSLVWTGHPARTSELIGAVHRFRQRDPAAYRSRADALFDLGVRFADVFEAGAADAVIEWADHYGQAMGALGRDARAPIVDEALSRAAELARSHGGAAKPSGAGGGDVAVGFFAGSSAANAFAHACSDAGLRPVDVAWGAEGVRPER